MLTALLTLRLDLGHFEIMWASSALYHVPWAVGEQFLWCGSTHCPVVIGVWVYYGGG